jgi:hypothetical protein
MKWGRIAVLGMAALMGAGQAWADDGDAALRSEISDLKERLSRLESRLASGGGSDSGAAVPSGVVLPSGLAGVELSGFVDTSFTYNINEPNNQVNGLRVFDTRDGDFMLNNVELAIGKAATQDSPVGFRADLHMGSDAEVTGSVTTGLGSTTDEMDIQQAYVEYLAPVGSGLNLKMGKLTTLAGAEVTESKDNWNISRSWLFGFAEPLTHTGVRAAYPISETVTGYVGINNGWDVVDDNNTYKSLETGATIALPGGVSLAATYLFGPEQARDNHDDRHFGSLVLGFDPTEQLHLKLAADIGYEQDGLSDAHGQNASWNGLAAYAKYDVTDRWALAGRVEIFNDQDAARLSAVLPTGFGLSVRDVQLTGITLTNEFKLHEHLIARAEYRHDRADDKIFIADQGLESYQNTVAFELIAPF